MLRRKNCNFFLQFAFFSVIISGNEIFHCIEEEPSWINDDRDQGHWLQALNQKNERVRLGAFWLNRSADRRTVSGTYAGVNGVEQTVARRAAVIRVVPRNQTFVPL